MEISKIYMRRAIELAEKGIGLTNPNPLVGAVIVKDGKIIGEGWHEEYGGLHAERNAIASLSESAEGASIYVTLEPCCHYGKTPPCTEAIIENKIARVIVGSGDPNPEVAGKGIAALRKAGIEVVENFMRKECDELNPVFFHYITNRTPYVVMKYAMTADGKIATKTGESKWITCEESRRHVQELRSRYMGIMAGIGTVLADDPLLNVRIGGKRSPVRIICDTNLRIPLNCRLCSTAGEYPLVIACGNEEHILGSGGMDKDFISNDTVERHRLKIEELEKTGAKVLEMPVKNGVIDLNALMAKLGGMNIDSILLEGGGTLNESALDAGIVNEVKAYIAPKIFGGAAKTPVCGRGVDVPDECHHMEMTDVSVIGDDILVSYRVKR